MIRIEIELSTPYETQSLPNVAEAIAHALDNATAPALLDAKVHRLVVEEGDA